MTGPNDSDGVTRPISVAELLARNGTIGAPPVGGRRRRRRGNSDAVTVAELTGEIPIVRPGATGEQPVFTDTEDHTPPVTEPAAEPEPVQPQDDTDNTVAPEAEAAEPAEAAAESAEPVDAVAEAAEGDELTEIAADDDTESESEPEAEPETSAIDDADTAVEPELEDTTDTDAVTITPDPAQTNGRISGNGVAPADTEEAAPTPFRPFGRLLRSGDPLPRRGRDAPPERSHDPRPARAGDPVRASAPPDAEAMSPDPLEDPLAPAAPTPDTAATHDEFGLGDIAFDEDEDAAALFGGDTLADERARGREPLSTARADALDEADLSEAFDESDEPPSRGRQVLHGLLIAAQSVLAVAFGAGLFLAFDQLWQWNSLVAMVLAILVTLGLVAGVWVVRKTEDIASTLIAVGVGLLVTFGPLALMHAA